MRAFACHGSAVALLLFALVAGLSAVTSAPSLAAWSSDPAQNLAIAEGSGEQVLPKIACGPDGAGYVGWFDNASGNYNVRLQRLDAAGNERWPHNGILVSGHPQDTWFSDWDLICDAQGNCVLTFTDIRSGNWDVQAYKVNADGTFPWGPDGINLSQNAAWEPSPSVCQASDGDYVFAWGRYPDAGGGQMMMQRLGPDGTLRFAVGGIAVVPLGVEEPGFPDLEPSLAGDVLLMYVRDIATFMTPRHIRLQRFNAAGAPVWPAFTAIFDGGVVPMGYAPQIQSDGAGGAVCGWHRASGSLFNSFVQRVSATGAEFFPHNGVAVSTDGTRNHIDPATAFLPGTGEIFVFWNERNSSQSQWGIYGQRFSSAGARLWAPTGLVLQPVNTVYKSYPRTLPLGDGAVCLFTDTPAGFNGDRLIAYRLDAAGNNVWPTVPLPVSTPQSGKSRLPLCIDAAGVTRIVWEDTRSGTPDIYGQNVNAEGTLGPGSEGIPPDGSPTVGMVANYPNPFRGSTKIAWAGSWAGGGGSTPGSLTIAGPDGRVVRQVTLRYLAASRDPANSIVWRWDGRDDAGREVAAGIYTYRWVLGSAAGPAGKAVRIR